MGIDVVLIRTYEIVYKVWKGHGDVERTLGLDPFTICIMLVFY